jgi:hypothetical protein
MSEANTVEVVLFKIKDGVTRAEFVKAARLTQDKIAQMKGFVRRQLLDSGDGQWVDLVWWTSKAEAFAAAEQFNADPDLAAFGSILDLHSINMLHLTPVDLTNGR